MLLFLPKVSFAYCVQLRFGGVFLQKINDFILIFQPNHRNLLSGAVSSLTDNDGTIDPKNFATIRTTSIVQRQQKEHLQVHSEMVSFLNWYFVTKIVLTHCEKKLLF